MTNKFFTRMLSTFLVLCIVVSTSVFTYAEESPVNIDYDYITDVITEVTTIEDNLNDLETSFVDLLNAKFTDEEMNDALAEAFLAGVDQELINELLESVSARRNSLRSSNSGEEEEKSRKEINAIYAERMQYARQIAEINKKRDRKAKDLDSETVYMYISHYLDIPGGPLALDMPKDHYSNNYLYSAWITKEDRGVYEKYLSHEMKEKARNASEAYLTYAQLAYKNKDEILEGLRAYEENIDNVNGLIQQLTRDI